jgi:hypothetical protein
MSGKTRLRRRIRNWQRLIRRLRESYERDLGRSPRIFRPRRLTEKIQWRKLFDLDPIYVVFSDKVAMRRYVEERVGADAVIPTLWLGNDPAAIPFDTLQPPYIIKCSHGSGWNLVVRDTAALDRAAVRAQFAEWLATDYGTYSIEPGYCAVPRRLLIQPLLTRQGGFPIECMFFVFDGVTRLIIHRVNTGDLHYERIQSYYDAQWRHLPMRTPDMPWTKPVPQPPAFDTMRAMAERLARDRDFLRVDLIADDEHVYVNEITCAHRSGVFQFEPDERDLELGEYWRLRRPMLRALRTILTRDWGIFGKPA